MAYLALIAAIGAALALALAVLVRAELFYLAGLAPLFPAFAILAHLLVIRSGSAADLRVTATFGLYSLIAYAAYLAGILYFQRIVAPPLAIACSIAVWLAVALILVEAWRRGCLAGKS